MKIEEIKKVVEGAIMAAGEPIPAQRIIQLFDGRAKVTSKDIAKVVKDLNNDYTDRAFEIKEVASGYRVQVRTEFAPYLVKMWEERPPRYSRALLETLSLVVYRQPITRAEVEDVRGVAVSTNIMKTLLEHDWVKIVGHKETPGKPALYASTKKFLDYFNLKTLDELPTLAELQDIDALEKKLGIQLNLEVAEKLADGEGKTDSEEAPESSEEENTGPENVEEQTEECSEPKELPEEVSAQVQESEETA